MTTEQKLKHIIEEELEILSCLCPGLAIRTENDRSVIARHLADSLMETRPSYRSGRRLSDQLKDTLLDVQKWWKKFQHRKV